MVKLQTYQRKRRNPDFRKCAIAAAILVWAPLFRGGNRPMPLLVLECLALAALAALAASRPLREAFAVKAAAVRWALAMLITVPLLQLVPLPYALWSALPGHAPHATAPRRCEP